MREIELSRGRTALVDDADYEMLAQWKWSCDGRYAVRSVMRARSITRYAMHRVLCEGKEIDHIDGNKLNNQRANLRAVTRSQNTQNQAARGASKYKGVYWQANRWLAQICHDRKSIYLGRYTDAADAARAYDVAALELYGVNAYTNFAEAQ